MPHRDDFDDDLMDPDSDAFDFKPIESKEGGSGKAVKIFVAVSVIAAIGAGAWYFVGSAPTSSDSVPVVRAEPLPTKVKPQDPGGMQVANRDKTVYERVSGENSEPKLERLLPRPETPLDKPVTGMEIPVLSQKTDGNTGQIAISKPLPLAEIKEEATAATEEVKNGVSQLAEEKMPAIPSEELAEEIVAPKPLEIESDPNSPRALVKREEQPTKVIDQQDKDALAAKLTEAIEDKTEAAPAPVVPDAPKVMPKTVEVAKVVSPKPTPPAPIQTTTTEKSGYLLQLLSSKDEAGVQKSWDKIKAKNSAIVSNLEANIVKADLGDKGIYYRLRLGPVATGDEAKSICAKLKKNDVGCFIVRVR